MLAVKGSSMEKGLCWGSLSVAGLMLLFFILDMALKIPFGGLNFYVDVFGLLASGVLLYLAIDALRDLR